MENPTSKNRDGDVWLSPAKHQSEYCWGPRNSSCTFGATWIPVSSTAWCLEVSGSINKLNIQIKTKLMNQMSILSASSKMSKRRPWPPVCIPRGRSLHLAQAVDSLLPAHSLKFPWKPALRMDMLMVGYSRGRTHLPWGNVASNWRGNCWGLKMSVINRNFL